MISKRVWWEIVKRFLRINTIFLSHAAAWFCRFVVHFQILIMTQTQIITFLGNFGSSTTIFMELGAGSDSRILVVYRQDNTDYGRYMYLTQLLGRTGKYLYAFKIVVLNLKIVFESPGIFNLF